MFWKLTLFVSVFVPVVCCSIISMYWKSAMRPDDPVAYKLNKMLLHHASVFEPRLPHHDGFWDLKWSILRHASVFFLFSTVSYFANSTAISTIFRIVYFFYTISVIFRYRVRKDIVKKMNSVEFNEIYTFCSKLVKPCKIVLIYSVVCLTFLFIPVNGQSKSEDTETTVIQQSVPVTEIAPLETLLPYASPVSGTISIGQPYNGPEDSEITVHASYRDCVVKLKTAEGKAVLSFFVRAGETATVGVPPKVLYAYFAEGDQWYGWSNYFGADTSYSMDPDPIDFSNYTIEYTLQMVSNGNLSLDHISASDF